ncbi:relaxase/mobilization nuclease domain-containing protein [Puia sp. P3]|uniref:relaxase/mobilization nuclease domain-containing protein n=1 Tax=Puia sp. P3 TaxID=3423952 RepID=UPI003D67DA54
MVARLNPVRSIAKPISYNEEKVAQGKAEFIHAGNFLQSKNNLSYEEKLDRFQRLNELNTRSKVKMLHITLNFSPKEKVFNGELADIADRYMQGLKMEDQPYLVYRHHDANHPHIHIVSSLIRPDGTRINTHQMGVRLSEPTRKAIEREFDLIPAQRRQGSEPPAPEEVRKISQGSSEPASEALDRVVSTVMKHYHFTNLAEYNAILRSYNVTAETGSLGSKTRQYNGLYYVALDDHGNRMSPPIMASQLPSRPTQGKLGKKYAESRLQMEDHVRSIKSRLDTALSEEPASMRALVSRLQYDSIEIVRPPANGRNRHDQVFVDHRTHTAITGKALDPKYSTAAIGEAITNRQRPAQQVRQQAKLSEDSRYSANVPQVLSAVLHTQPAGPDHFGHDQYLGHRHRR